MIIINDIDINDSNSRTTAVLGISLNRGIYKVLIHMPYHFWFEMAPA